MRQVTKNNFGTHIEKNRKKLFNTMPPSKTIVLNPLDVYISEGEFSLGGIAHMVRCVLTGAMLYVLALRINVVFDKLIAIVQDMVSSKTEKWSDRENLYMSAGIELVFSLTLLILFAVLTQLFLIPFRAKKRSD